MRWWENNSNIRLWGWKVGGAVGGNSKRILWSSFIDFSYSLSFWRLFFSTLYFIKHVSFLFVSTFALLCCLFFSHLCSPSCHWSSIWICVSIMLSNPVFFLCVNLDHNTQSLNWLILFYCFCFQIYFYVWFFILSLILLLTLPTLVLFKEYGRWFGFLWMNLYEGLNKIECTFSRFI